MTYDMIYKLASIYCYGGLKELLDELGVKEETRKFLEGEPSSRYRYYIPAIKARPRISVEELREIEIPQEEGADPYDNRERKHIEGLPEELGRWFLVELRKARRGRSIEEISAKKGDEHERWHKLKEWKQGILDWYRGERPQIASYSGERAIESAKRWHEATAAGGFGQYYKEGEAHIVYGPKWKEKKWDGWTIREIKTENDLEVEGNRMHHCVGSYGEDLTNGYVQIYSLRDSRNEPHVTMESRGGGYNFNQIMGKSNQEPLKEYKSMIGEWFKSIGTDQVYIESLDLGEHLDYLEEGDTYNAQQIPILIEKLLNSNNEYGLPYTQDKLSEEEALRLYLGIIRGFMGRHYDDVDTYHWMYNPIDTLAFRAVKDGVDAHIEEAAHRDLDQLIEMVDDRMISGGELEEEPSWDDYGSDNEYTEAHQEWEARENKVRDRIHNELLMELPYSLADRFINKVQEYRGQRKAA